VEIPGYEICNELGKGGMGAVYRGIRENDRQQVAVKIMLAKVAVTEDARQMFLREIQVTQELKHRNIVRFYESGGAGSAFYLAMEYCCAGSLDQFLNARGGKVPLHVANSIMLQCLKGLDYAHELDFIHRDLKP
jgi:serine/threonine protein kinase